MQQESAFIPKDKKIGNKLTVFNSTKQSFAIICLCGDVSSCLQDVKSKLTAWNTATDQPVFSSSKIKNVIYIFSSMVVLDWFLGNSFVKYIITPFFQYMNLIILYHELLCFHKGYIFLKKILLIVYNGTSIVSYTFMGAFISPNF